ncbi:MAG: rhodanese-like domain-containing protein [Clostridium sp.]
MKKLLTIFLITLLTLSVFVGCSNSSTDANKDSVGTTSYSSEYLMDTDSFKKIMAEENTVIVDARGDKDYSKGHIKGAIPAAWQPFTSMNGNPGDKGWGVLLPKDELAKKVGELGINKDKKVVVYGNKDGWGDDGRIVWTLRAAGINAVMLNGGIDLWKSQGNEISKDVVEVKPTEFAIDKMDMAMNITTDELKNDYKNIKVIDARAEDEYNGATKFGEVRGGHLPGSKLLTFSEVYNQDGTIKSVDELKKIFEEKGLKKEDVIVTYCTAGIRSAHLALALKTAGYENVRNYDASFHEWAGDRSNPLEK